jgi:hypothetical protein
MAEVSTSIKERFCWVKAVLQAPSCDVVSDPSKPWTLPCAEGGPNETMRPPPVPALLVDATGLGPSIRGSGTPPPDQARAPKFPASAEGDFWRMASFLPGEVVPDSGPIVTLVFMPIIGSRDDVKTWRRQNPAWFADAVAVTLLSYEF